MIMTDDINIETMSRCFAAGLDGYLLEDISQQSLADSLRLVRLGEKIFPSRLASIIVDYSRQLIEPQIWHGQDPGPPPLRARGRGAEVPGQRRLQQADRPQARHQPSRP